MAKKGTINFGKTVQIIKVIRTTLTSKGNGKDDPFRYVEQYWDLNGNLIFEVDGHNKFINGEE
jgi:hypothetical protein